MRVVSARVRRGTAAAVVLGTSVLGMLSAPSAQAASWDCKYRADSEYTNARCVKDYGRNIYVGGYYIASNDSLEVRDYFDNGRWTIVFVKVGGEGTARYTSKGEKLRELDLDYPEGRSIKIKACTSASPNAVCSAWSPAGTT